VAVAAALGMVVQGPTLHVTVVPAVPVAVPAVVSQQQARVHQAKAMLAVVLPQILLAALVVVVRAPHLLMQRMLMERRAEPVQHLLLAARL